MPMVNILSGGLHAAGAFEFQDFMVVPHGFPNYSDSLRAVVAIHRATRRMLEREGHALTGVADEEAGRRGFETMKRRSIS